MDILRYRTQARPAALNTRRSGHGGPGRRRWWMAACCVLIVLAAGSRTCVRPGQISRSDVARLMPEELVTELAKTRLEAALERIGLQRPDEALALVVAALEADPHDGEACATAVRILRDTTWHFPEMHLRHPMPIERLHMAAPASLWVGLAGDQSTMVCWDLAAPRIESVLFPVPQAGIRSMILCPTQHRLVVERAGRMLLCDARTLKPVKSLGALPDYVTPASVVVFSADGLLLAHPALTEQGEVLWQLRDAASGELLRTSEPLPDVPRPLTAFLERRLLRVLMADGSLLEIPVSPVDPTRIAPADRPLALLHAQYAADGATALASIDQGPHRPPVLAWLPGEVPPGMPLAAADWFERFPWSAHPDIWNGLLRGSPHAPLRSEDGRCLLLNQDFLAPIHASTAITAAAAAGPLTVVGEENGMVSLFRKLPKPKLRQSPAARQTDPPALAAFRLLVEFLTGMRTPGEDRETIRLDAPARLESLKACDFPALGRLFPELDFSPLVEHARLLDFRGEAPADALAPLVQRLARAEADPASPAARLALALDSEWPQWIEECLATAHGMPPVLRKLAESRIAWLQGRKADALAGWPEIIPKYEQLRLHEDWDGWEQADFGPAFVRLQACLDQELAALELPENPAAEVRREVAARLLDPAALRAVGRVRYAMACLRASLALAGFKEDAGDALKLAVRARELGAPPQPCLRAEARALASLENFPQAHDRWLALITGQPIATHEPADYAEAAYTAFETGDPRQAMEILTTGLHRFPHDADFAMRAGWVSLLTGHPDRAHRFLLAAREAGFPPEKLEHAMAMLAIAAAQCGLADDAAVYYQDLIGLNPDWKQPEYIEKLDWPDELKAALRQLIW